MPTADQRLFPEARQVLGRLLARLDARAPGLITGAHLTGSIALGDGRPGQSDIDLVLVRAAGFDNAATTAALEPALADLRRELPAQVIDALVIDETELAAGPDGIEADRPIIQQGEFGRGAGGLSNPVTWATLRQCGIAYRGELDLDRLWHDPARLDAWTRDNLERYWRPWLAGTDRLASRSGMISLGDWATEWGVLGVTRLHATLATGEIVSKRGAGEYALEAFSGEWRRIVEEAIRIRERRPGGHYRSRLKRRRDMRAYMAMVITDALALPNVS